MNLNQSNRRSVTNDLPTFIGRKNVEISSQ